MKSRIWYRPNSNKKQILGCTPATFREFKFGRRKNTSVCLNWKIRDMLNGTYMNNYQNQGI